MGDNSPDNAVGGALAVGLVPDVDVGNIIAAPAVAVGANVNVVQAVNVGAPIAGNDLVGYNPVFAQEQLLRQSAQLFAQQIIVLDVHEQLNDDEDRLSWLVDLMYDCDLVVANENMSPEQTFLTAFARAELSSSTE